MIPEDFFLILFCHNNATRWIEWSDIWWVASDETVMFRWLELKQWSFSHFWFSLIIAQKSYSKNVHLPPSIWKWFKWRQWQVRQLHNFPLNVELQILSFRNKISSFPRWLRRRITLPALISWWKLPTHTRLVWSHQEPTFLPISSYTRGCEDVSSPFVAGPVVAKQLLMKG